MAENLFILASMLIGKSLILNWKELNHFWKNLNYSDSP